MATSNQQQKRSNQSKISLKKVESQLINGLGQADKLRHEGFAGLAHVKRIKLVQTRRERGRLEAKYGVNDPRVQQLDRQMVAEHQTMVFARVERDKTAIPIPARDKGKFILFGHMRDIDGYPLQDYQVGLYTQATGKTEALAAAGTDKTGLYEISFPVAAAGAKADAAEKARLSPTLYLLVRNPAGKIVYTNSRSIAPVAGKVVYWDVVVEDVSQPACGSCQTRFLGNSGTRELHDLENEKPKCELAKMRPDHRVYFSSTEEAEKAGYDYCAYCFSKQQSKR
jgi:hypothetical protein